MENRHPATNSIIVPWTPSFTIRKGKLKRSKTVQPHVKRAVEEYARFVAEY